MLIISLALKSIVLLSLASLISLFMRRNSAAVRHLVWTVAFAGLLLLPFLSVSLPAFSLPVAAHIQEASELTFKTDVLGRFAGSSPADSHLQRPTSTPRSSSRLPVFVGLLWLLGTAIGLAQMVIGWVKLQQLRTHASVVAEPFNGVSLLETSAGSMPMTYGLFTPVIFLPADARDWCAKRLHIVLEHELAHIMRGDCATHVLARTALSVYWWNPIAWFAWREFLKEQERAADDHVLSEGTSRSEYARHLLEIARSLQASAFTGPVAAMANTSDLSSRVKAILEDDRNRSPLRKSQVIAAITLAVALITPLAAMQSGTGKYPLELLKQGDEAGSNGKFEDAKQIYDKFLSGNPGSAYVAQAHIHRGIIEMIANDYRSAILDFESAEAADAKTLSESLMWEAIANERLKDMGEAARLYQSALTAADPQSQQSATVLRLYSRLLSSQGHIEEAKQADQRASEIRLSQPALPDAESAYRAGGEVSSPQLLTKVEPEYSMEARVAHYSGVVRLSVIIGTDGHTKDIRVTNSLGLGLDEKAMDAVRQWTFKPGMKDGQPVSVRATIEVKFKLL
jgi:TonB family protein